MASLTFARHALRFMLIGAMFSMFGAYAYAQTNNPYDESLTTQTPETVQVVGPHLERGRSPLNGPPESISLSGAIRSDDLNLRTSDGGSQLRWRVRDGAQDVCLQLARIDPYRQAPGTDCYKDATRDGLRRANKAISNAQTS